MSKTSTKMIYYFGKTKTEGKGNQKTLLGGKGANLAEMTSIGLPVPPGFTITTEVCDLYYKSGRKLPAGLMDEVAQERRHAWKRNSARSSATRKTRCWSRSAPVPPSSMPGMMNTILNLGLNDEAVVGLANATGNERFAYDAYRRLINMFGDVVCGVDHEHFEARLRQDQEEVQGQGRHRRAAGRHGRALRRVQEGLQEALRQAVPAGSAQAAGTGRSKRCSRAGCSRGPLRIARSKTSRGLLGHGGQRASRWSSATWATTRARAWPSRAIRPPARTSSTASSSSTPRAKTWWPAFARRSPSTRCPSGTRQVYEQLLEIKDKLEKHYKDVQDIEFTIEKGTLFMLQTRNGKRTGAAAVKIACDMVKEKLIDEKTAVLRIPAGDLTQLLLPSFGPAAKQAAKKEGRC